MTTRDHIAKLRDTANELRLRAALLDAMANDLADVSPDVDVSAPDTVQGVLDAAGVVHFDEDELRRASEKWPPPVETWERLAAVMVVADRIRERVGVPLDVRSYWRPSDADSQHRFGSAVDLDIVSGHRSPQNIDRLRMVALDEWEVSTGQHGALAGVGLYHQPKYRIHIDTKHERSKGHRFWYQDEAETYLNRLASGERPT